MKEAKYHIENNSVQETLIIPLFGRKVCSEHFPDLFRDEEAERICAGLDYDFAAKQKKMESKVGLFGALEVAQRQYDLAWEASDYLKAHPNAAVVNLGCGLDDTFRKVDSGSCLGFNIDMPDVIRKRSEILPAAERETNIGCDLNDYSWMDRIDAGGGAVFFAAGVFYYFRTEDVERLLRRIVERFPGARIAFDVCNRRGAKMMTKTWLREAGITDVDALFSVDDAGLIPSWLGAADRVSERSYMRGYRDIYKDVGFLHRMMIKFCDGLVRMRIVRIDAAK